jgi:hypothetical protein
MAMTLDLIGYVVLTAAVFINAFVFTNALTVSPAMRIGLVAAAGVWSGLQLALYAAGAFQAEITNQAPLVGIMVATPLIVTAIAAAASPGVRATLLAVPLHVLIGLNVMRVFGGFFVILAMVERLSGPFPYFAGLGDIVTGLIAIPLALSAARGDAAPGSVFAWNTLGALDLINAVTLGTLSSNGFAFQLFTSGAGSAAVQHMPWLLIPAVLVPFYLITHGIVYAQLRQERVTATA